MTDLTRLLFMSKVHRNLIKNRLLSALPREEYERLLPHLETVSLRFNQIIYAPNEPIQHVYFPNSGIISLVNLDVHSNGCDLTERSPQIQNLKSTGGI
jgi:hypothetical protein